MSMPRVDFGLDRCRLSRVDLGFECEYVLTGVDFPEQILVLDFVILSVALKFSFLFNFEFCVTTATTTTATSTTTTSTTTTTTTSTTTKP